MIPTSVTPDATIDRVCALADHWKIAAELALKLHLVAKAVPYQFAIISGFRTKEEQAALARDPTKTAAADDLSTHRSCPATGADIRVHGSVTPQVKRAIGRAAEGVGLRWGGGAQREDGIPVGNEWAHFDLGPRNRG